MCDVRLLLYTLLADRPLRLGRQVSDTPRAHALLFVCVLKGPAVRGQAGMPSFFALIRRNCACLHFACQSCLGAWLGDVRVWRVSRDFPSLSPNSLFIWSWPPYTGALVRGPQSKSSYNTVCCHPPHTTTTRSPVVCCAPCCLLCRHRGPSGALSIFCYGQHRSPVPQS